MQFRYRIISGFRQVYKCRIGTGEHTFDEYEMDVEFAHIAHISFMIESAEIALGP